MAVIFFVCLVLLVYLNRFLYLRVLLLTAQVGALQRVVRARRKRVVVPENFRRLWVWVARLFPGAWQKDCHIFTPATILDWVRRRYKDYWTLKVQAGKRSGRPCISEFLQEEIARLALENPAWTPRRIQGEVYRLHGKRLNISTVRKYMPSRNSDPRKVMRWADFLRLNLPNISAMDFFMIPRFGKNPLIGFFVLQHDRRKLLAINVTEHPTTEWIIEQLITAFMGHSHALTFLLSDNDRLYAYIGSFVEETLGMRQVRTQLASPWQNGIAERFVRTLREELLQFMVPLSEEIVRRRLLEYQKYYNEHRTHSSLDLDSPEGRAIGPPPGENVRLIRRKVLGGLHSTYHWEAA